MTMFYTCPDCGEESEVEVTPFISGKTWGPPESCYPDEGGEVEPEACPHCGIKWDTTKISKQAEDSIRDDYD